MSKQRPNRRKHIPQRTCIICRQSNAKRALIRIVRTADEGVQIDPSGKRNGRGAYWCEDMACWQEALGTHDPEIAFDRALAQLERALRTSLSTDDRDRMRAVMLPDK